MYPTGLAVLRMRSTAKALAHMDIPGLVWLPEAHRWHPADSSAPLLHFYTPKASEWSPGQMEVDTNLLLPALRQREATPGLQLNLVSLKSSPQKLLNSHLVKTSNCR